MAIERMIYTMTTDNNFMNNIPFEQIEVLNHKTILDLELANLYKSVRQHPLPRRKSDPVSTQIFVHNFQNKILLPSISLSHRVKTDFEKEKRNKTQFKGKRFETLPTDFQCQPKFPKQQGKRRNNTQRGENSRKKHFIEIDMLNLMTWYAKNDLNKEANPKDSPKGKDKLEAKDQIHEIAKIPTKNGIPTFIQNYKVLNEQLNVDDLVRSPRFGVNYKEKQYLYFGQLNRGQMDGKGILVTLISIFQGFWSQSKRVEGIQITPKGIYKGKFVNDERSKVGQFFWNNGQYFSGQWSKNKKHGTGVWKSSNGDVYMGQWVKGKVNGYGSHLTKKGQKYEGYFVNFLKHGQGKQLFPNGDYFEGTFKQGRPHGLGIYKWKNGITYEGEFKEGFRDGNGLIKKLGIQYEGSFVKEKADGAGKLIVINGDNFSGSFKKGKKQGKGIHHENRCIYVGAWHNNKFIQKQI